MGRPGKKARTPQLIDDETILTQYGEGLSDTHFRNMLRPNIGETEMSLIYGGLDAAAAGLLITKVKQPYPLVRHTTAGELRKYGFVVEHSPSYGNPLHVSVYPPKLDEMYEDWDTELAAKFDSCFTGHDGRG